MRDVTGIMITIILSLVIAGSVITFQDTDSWFQNKPKVGEKYSFSFDKKDDPYAKRDTVTVLEVKEGYIKYQYTNGGIDHWSVRMFNHQSIKIKQYEHRRRNKKCNAC